MNTIKIATLVAGLAMISLFSIGCGPGNTQKKYGISEKNRKILDNDALFTSLSPQDRDKVVNAVIEVITEDFNIRTTAESAARANTKRAKLMGRQKVLLDKIAKMPDSTLHQKVKDALEDRRSEIVDLVKMLENPKNALIALDNLDEYNTIWSEAKDDTSAYDELKKLFDNKLGNITDTKDRKIMAREIYNGFLPELDEMIIDNI
jgi:hypothetical protein